MSASAVPMVLFVIAIIYIFVWFAGMLYVVDAAKDKGYDNVAGLWFVGLFTAVIAPAAIVAAMPDKSLKLNLLIRAHQFEDERDWTRAIEYYEKVLDIDALNNKALEGIENVKKARSEYVFYEESDTTREGKEQGSLQLKEDNLFFKNNDKSGNSYLYKYSNLATVENKDGSLVLQFLSGNAVVFDVSKSAKWCTLINQAKEGIYPKPE